MGEVAPTLRDPSPVPTLAERRLKRSPAPHCTANPLLRRPTVSVCTFTFTDRYFWWVDAHT
jgi:hypothetical protein